MTKLQDQLQFMRDEVQRSKRWRSKTQMDELWHRMIDLYKGKHYSGATETDRLVVNLAFATKNVIAPAVAIRNPRFVVNARDPEKAAQAIITEEVLNYQWRCHKYQDEVRLAVDDWILCGHGWIKTGYKFVKEHPQAKPAGDMDDENQIDPGDTEGVDDREPIEGNTETEMIVTYDRPYLERISIFDMFVDPDARHPKEMRWIAQRTWRPVQDVRVDERYSASARKCVGGSSYSRWEGEDSDGRGGADKPDNGPLTYCEVIEFYDLKRRTVATFALNGSDSEDGQAGRDSFLIKPAPTPYGFDNPFIMLRGYEVPDHFYSMGDLESIESLQRELNKTRTQMINHRKRFSRKWLYNQDAFDTDGVNALKSDVDNTMVPVKDSYDLSGSVVPMPSITTPADFYNHSALIENDINQVTGVSDYQRGQAEQSIRRTATEAAMIQDAANARAQDRLAKVESFLAEAGERIIKLMQQFMTGEQVVRIVGISGRAWVSYDRDYIQGDFDFEVEGGSTEPRNESFRRQSALQLVDAMAPFVGAGVVDPAALSQYVLQYGFGVTDPGRFLVQQPQMQDPMAQEQPLPPGSIPPGMDPQAAQMAPPPMGGMPQAPPEQVQPAPGDMAALMQMLGSGAPSVV